MYLAFSSSGVKQRYHFCVVIFILLIRSCAALMLSCPPVPLPVAPCWVPLPVSCRLTVCASTHISCISNFHSYMAYHSPKAAGENRHIFSILHVLAATKHLLLIPLNLFNPSLFPYHLVC
jgi:hypothetical protein